MSDDDSSDDDVPLAELKKQAMLRAAAKAKAKKSPKPTSTPKKAAAKKKKKAPSSKTSAKKSAKKAKTATSGTKRKRASSSSKSAKSAKKKSTSTATKKKKKSGSGTSEADREYSPIALTSKEQIVERILVRWWYAMDWPTKFSAAPEPAKEFAEMRGIKGVFVGIYGASIGKVVDTRDSRGCPCSKSLLKKKGAALQATLVKALTKQTEQLIAAEGEGSSFLPNLRKEMKYATKIKPDKIDAKFTREQKKK